MGHQAHDVHAPANEGHEDRNGGGGGVQNQGKAGPQQPGAVEQGSEDRPENERRAQIGEEDHEAPAVGPELKLARTFQASDRAFGEGLGPAGALQQRHEAADHREQ